MKASLVWNPGSEQPGMTPIPDDCQDGDGVPNHYSREEVTSTIPAVLVTHSIVKKH